MILLSRLLIGCSRHGRNLPWSPFTPTWKCATLDQPYPGAPFLGPCLSLLGSQPPLDTWSPPLRDVVSWQPILWVAHSPLGGSFCQLLRAGGYMLNPPESSPHGEAAWATEEHCTRGSEAWTLVRLVGSSNRTWGISQGHTLCGEGALSSSQL